ncbi:MAG: 23S rRNA (guanosine(2251)-2'-O)-methyltransferase RlmB [bacterium]|nr:23S rRNA (guanosine(2251)-2'-O)-methyltransferase RlmB [bacterium]
MSNSENFYIYGRKPVEELAENNSNSVNKVFIRNSIPPNSYKNLSSTLKANSIPFVTVPEKKIESLVGNVNHQGFVAQRSSLEYANFYEWIETIDLRTNPSVFLLNGIEDPHNFGAILRTAAAAGISAVIVPSHNQAPLNATVFKTSAGTAGRIPVIRVQDSNQAFKDLKLSGFEIYALDGNAKTTLWEVEFNLPSAFVIGNEGRGVDKKILKNSDHTLMLPMENNVESLNASVTAALIAYDWKRKRSV